MTRKLKAGVAGAGVFGGYHARKYQQSEAVELVGVYDRGTGRALELANQTGVRGFEAGEWDDFVDQLDVLTVAAPAVAHASLAVRAIERGVHVYVEKPIAPSIQEAEAIIAAGAENARVVACGHQERVIFEAMGLFSAPEVPLRIEAIRQGPWTGRSTDISVVLDLMIHDLDLALSLGGDQVTSLTAQGRALKGSLADQSKAEITFESGMVAAFEASRAAEGRKRTMRVIYPSGEIEIDFLERTFRNTTPFSLDPGFAETPRGADPLGASVSDFLDAVRGIRGRPAVTGEEGARALALALAIDEVGEPRAPARKPAAIRAA